MLDVYTALDVALRSQYLTTITLPAAPIWGRMPAELRSAFVVALASGGCKTAIGAMWSIRELRHGRPDWGDERYTLYVRLRLGMLYLAHLKGAFGAEQLITSASYTNYSHVWDKPQQQDFRDRYRVVTAVGRDADNLAALFAPYLDAATRCVEEWGLV